MGNSFCRHIKPQYASSSMKKCSQITKLRQLSYFSLSFRLKSPKPMWNFSDGPQTEGDLSAISWAVAESRGWAMAFRTGRFQGVGGGVESLSPPSLLIPIASSGVSKSTPGFSNWLEGHKWKPLYSQLWFLTVQEYRLESATERVHGVCRIWSFQLSCPSGAWTSITSPNDGVWLNTLCIANQGSSPEPLCPQFLLGLDHIDMAEDVTNYMLTLVSSSSGVQADVT